MKVTLSNMTLLLVTLLSMMASAQEQTFNCINEAHSVLNFELSLNAKSGLIVFGQETGGYSVENDLAGKKLKLTFSPEDSSSDYLQYVGDLEVNSFHDLRNIQIRVAKTELSKKANLRLTMSPSNSYFADSEPTSYSVYGMRCQVKAGQ